MKKVLIITAILVFSMCIINTGFSESKRYDHEVEFGDSKAEKVIQISGNGNLNVTGYKGDKVLISSNEDIFKEYDENNEKTKGLKKISKSGFNIINNKKENIVFISRPMDRHIDLDIKVPNNVTLKLGSDVNRPSWRHKNILAQFHSNAFHGNKNALRHLYRDISKLNNILGGLYKGILEGDVNIKYFSGIVEVNTIQGDIDAENIEGEIIASTVEGDINISFNKLNKDRALYFSTINGEIDITFPKDTKADIMAKTLGGDVYSGFNGDVTFGKEIEDEPAPPGPPPGPPTEPPIGPQIGPQIFFKNIFQSNNITTQINGGGQGIYLSTINGNIYIRKGN